MESHVLSNDCSEAEHHVVAVIAGGHARRRGRVLVVTPGRGSLVRVTPHFAQQGRVLPGGQRQHDGKDSDSKHVMLTRSKGKQQASGVAAQGSVLLGISTSPLRERVQPAGISPVIAENPAPRSTNEPVGPSGCALAASHGRTIAAGGATPRVLQSTAGRLDNELTTGPSRRFVLTIPSRSSIPCMRSRSPGMTRIGRKRHTCRLRPISLALSHRGNSDLGNGGGYKIGEADTSQASTPAAPTS
jgi:hypothetical protein